MTQDPYEPPRAEITMEPAKAKEEAPTVGYLIGGLVQLAFGVGLSIATLGSGAPGLGIIFGLFLLFLGVRTVVKYRVRTRRSR